MRIVSLDSEVTFSSHFLETSPVDQTIIGQVTENRTFPAVRAKSFGLGADANCRLRIPTKLDKA
jgi:hypothetical protein